MPYELPIELIVGIVGSVLFIALLLYRLKNGRKVIRLKGAGITGCGSVASSLDGGEKK